MRIYREHHLDTFAEQAAAYWFVFWETMNAHLDSIPHPEVVFPSFLQPGTRAIHVMLNRYGLTVGSRYSDTWTMTKQWSDDEEVAFDETFAVGMVATPEPVDMMMLGIQGSVVSGELSPWHLVRSVSNVDQQTFSLEKAKAEAKDIALYFTTQHLLGMDASNDASSPTAVAARIRELADDFEAILESATREEDIQRFLTANPALIDMRAIEIKPKVRLGDDFVTDYVVRLPGDEYVFIEIEAAKRLLYTLKNDPTAEMTHAIKQVEDWLEWSYENKSYLAKKLPGLHDPQGVVIMGRRETLTEGALQSLRRRNRLNAIKVRTFDDLVDIARATAENISNIP